MSLCFGQLMLLLANMLQVSSEQCKSGIFHINPNRFDTKLDRYRIGTFENISPRMCFDKCIRRPRCHSYNYNRHLLRCELNYQPAYVSFNDFLNEVGFMYVEVGHYRGDPLVDSCLGNPCKPDEICEGTNDGGVFCVKEHEEIDDCTHLKNLNPTYESGVYTINPAKTKEGIHALCNMMSGGWTVFQRRINGSENFRRTWVEYENGFGDLQHEFWLGNKYIDILTSKGTYKLRVELVNSNGTNYYAEYSTFKVSNTISPYRLTVGGYSGNAGNGMINDNGRSFSTFDNIYHHYWYSCVDQYGAWWHSYTCSSVGLNNQYTDNLLWGNNYYIESQMMIKRTA